MKSKSSQGILDWDDEIFLKFFEKFEKVIINLPVVKRYDEYYRDYGDISTSPLCKYTRPEEHIRITFKQNTHKIYEYYYIELINCSVCGEYADWFNDISLSKCKCENSIDRRMYNELSYYVNSNIDFEEAHPIPELIDDIKICNLKTLTYYDFRQDFWFYNMSRSLRILYNKIYFDGDNSKYENFMEDYNNSNEKRIFY